MVSAPAPRRLRNRLLRAYRGASLLPLVAVILAIGVATVGVAVPRAVDQRRAAAEEIATLLDAEIAGLGTQAAVAAREIGLALGAADDVLLRLRLSDERIIAATLVDRAGAYLAGTADDLIVRAGQPAPTALAEPAAASLTGPDLPTVTAIHRVERVHSVVIAAPVDVAEARGDVAVVLAVAVSSLDTDAAVRRHLATTALVNRSGDTLLASDPDLVLEQFRWDLPLGSGLLRHGGAFVVRGTAAVASLHGVLVVSQEAASAALGQTMLIGVVGVALLLVAIVAQRRFRALLNRELLEPLEALAATANRVAEGDLDARVAMDRDDELGEVAGALDAMTVSLRQTVTALTERISELDGKVAGLEGYAATVAHDLRGPLGTIRGLAEVVLERRGDELAPMEHDVLTRIVASSDRQLQLVEDLLALAEAQRGDHAFEEVNLAAVAAVAVADHAGLISSLGAEVRTDVDAIVRGNRPLLEQLASNLVGNALKYHHPDRRPLVEVATTPHGDNGTVTLSVVDNGVGIPAEDRARVFEPFTRLVATRQRTGTGLGLAMVRHVADLHGATISVGDGIDGGTSVMVTLPVGTLRLQHVEPTEEAHDAPNTPST